MIHAAIFCFRSKLFLVRVIYFSVLIRSSLLLYFFHQIIWFFLCNNFLLFLLIFLLFPQLLIFIFHISPLLPLLIVILLTLSLFNSFSSSSLFFINSFSTRDQAVFRPLFLPIFVKPLIRLTSLSLVKLSSHV